MREHLDLLFHVILTLIKLSKPGGIKAVMVENITLRQQLITLNRGRKRAPKLTTFDRFLFGFSTFIIAKNRLEKTAIILKPATFLNFHKALVKRKYQQLYSNKTKKRPGRKSPDRILIDLVIEMKKRNPTFGYGRISGQIFQAFGVKISRFAVGRILRKNKSKLPSGDGPSWLSFIGHLKDSLWSVDLFRCESITLKSFWIMVVMDICTRRIIGFSVHQGQPDGVAYCCKFNEIVSGHVLPKHLSRDNDPMFRCHRWQANLRILDIDEIKSVPEIPVSHPYVERIIGTVRREYLDHVLFFNERDLLRKLNRFKQYYNVHRSHSSLDQRTPKQIADEALPTNNVVTIEKYRWKSQASGLYQLPVAA